MPGYGKHYNSYIITILKPRLFFMADDVFFLNCFLLAGVGAMAEGPVNSWLGGHGGFTYTYISSP